MYQHVIFHDTFIQTSHSETIPFGLDTLPFLLSPERLPVAMCRRSAGDGARVTELPPDRVDAGALLAVALYPATSYTLALLCFFPATTPVPLGFLYAVEGAAIALRTTGDTLRVDDGDGDGRVLLPVEFRRCEIGIFRTFNKLQQMSVYYSSQIRKLHLQPIASGSHQLRFMAIPRVWF